MLKWKSIDLYPIDMSRTNSQRNVFLFCPARSYQPSDIVIGHGLTWQGLDEDEHLLFHSFMSREGDRRLHPTHWSEIPKDPVKEERLPRFKVLRKLVLAKKLAGWLDRVVPHQGQTYKA